MEDATSERTSESSLSLEFVATLPRGFVELAINFNKRARALRKPANVSIASRGILKLISARDARDKTKKTATSFLEIYAAHLRSSF